MQTGEKERERRAERMELGDNEPSMKSGNERFSRFLVSFNLMRFSLFFERGESELFLHHLRGAWKMETIPCSCDNFAAAARLQNALS